MVPDLKELPVAVVGAGPVGLAASAHLLLRGLELLVFERGEFIGSTDAKWAHVRVSSPWEYNGDSAARSLLEAGGWTIPAPEYLPTGGELIADYLAPLAEHPDVAPRLRLSTTIRSVTRQGHSKLSSFGRDESPFIALWTDASGNRNRAMARAVIDASGTWVKPNPIEIDGLPAEGEVEAKDSIAYGTPGLLRAAQSDHAGRHTLVIGVGHSALTRRLT